VYGLSREIAEVEQMYVLNDVRCHVPITRSPAVTRFRAIAIGSTVALVSRFKRYADVIKRLGDSELYGAMEALNRCEKNRRGENTVRVVRNRDDSCSLRSMLFLPPPPYTTLPSAVLTV
jgi:hypothetical protein